ncbi:MAG TPA: ATP-binding protein [Polyangia bacterium]|jgi:two-component system NtrC family sensor kinase
MAERPDPGAGDEAPALRAEIARLNKVVKALIKGAERGLSAQGTSFGMFQTAVMLDDRVRGRTQELEAALRENEKMNRALQRTQLEKAQEIDERTRAYEAVAREKEQQATLFHRLENAKLELLQSEKLASVGRLAAGIAHEVNNPLAVILGFAQALQRRQAEDDPNRLAVASIIRETVRCKALVEELLTFSRAAKRTTEAVELNELVRSTATLFEARARSQNVRVVSELCEAPAVVDANRDQLQQVLVNLGANALDAMGDAGVLTLRTRRENGAALFEVADTGAGIAEEDRARIFEPFFTTKEVGKGTGLGLSLAYEIVQQHGGAIEVQSALGAGTTVRVRLPGAAPPAGAGAP